MGAEEGSLLIAIDGPAASGKSTVARELAGRLGLMIVDSGSMYRAVALLAVERGISAGDAESLAIVAKSVRQGLSLRFEPPGTLRIYLGNREVTGEVRSKRVTEAVSVVSEVAAVRREMVGLQRSLVEGRGAVVEGRDIGTTVFPDAKLKVYLDATLGERARRRYLEYLEKGLEVTIEGVEEEIAKRDGIDSAREISPLSKAPDAAVVDTTSMSVPWVVESIVGILNERGLG